MPERQSTPGGATAEQDAEGEAIGPAGGDQAARAGDDVTAVIPARPAVDARRGEGPTVATPRPDDGGPAPRAAAAPAEDDGRTVVTSRPGAPAAEQSARPDDSGHGGGRSGTADGGPVVTSRPSAGASAAAPSAPSSRPDAGRKVVTSRLPADARSAATTRPDGGQGDGPTIATARGPQATMSTPDGEPTAPVDPPARSAEPTIVVVRTTKLAPGPEPDLVVRTTKPAPGPEPDPDAETTQVLPRPDAPTVTIAVHAPDDPEEPSPRPRRRRALIATGGFVAALALFYVGDLALSSGSVPRGVTVTGIPVGGLALADAEQTLRAQIEPRTTQPVPVMVGDAKTTVDPKAAGLAVDWRATVARAGDQPLNPITRIASFFSTREIGVVTRSDPAALDAALTELKPAVDKPAVEGNVRFDGVTPQPVNPAPGQQLDVPAAAAVLARDWASGGTVALPLTRVEPVTSADDVARALEKVAKPAVAAPITITGENDAQATLTPQNIASALTFRPDPATGLVPDLNQDALTTALKPQLADSETPGRDATLDFTGPTPVVIPSQDGRGVDYPATLKVLLPVLTATAPRQVAAVYADQPAKLTTEGLSKLGIQGIIGEFTTRGFAADSGKNIKRAAEQINGTIVQPGATFSLNALTNPRDAAHGYVEAGIIEDGHPARGIGGGVSQVATTLFNAAYFAGMTNVEHKEHSFYISRYPVGREATVFDNVIDLKFRNDNPTAIMIQTVWTPSSLTVRIYGTKRYDVTSTSGPRTNPTDPKTVTIPEGEPCSPSKGAPGFTVTDTRTLRDVSSGQTRSETRTVRYNPSPIIVCGPDQ